MSEERYKLHWITALIEVLKTLKEMIFPLIVLIFANGFQDSGTGKWYWDYLSFIILGVLIIVFFITGIIKWKRFVYWFEDDELRIEYGLFVKKKRYIPFHRIQSLDYTEGILHRPLKLVKVKVETAGGADISKSDAELTAITKEAAKRIEEKMAESKQRKIHKIDDFDEFEPVAEPSQKLKAVYKMDRKDLLVLATTSGGIGLILSGVLIFLVQFAEFIPFDKMYVEISEFIKYGVIIVVIVVLLGLLVIWGVSVLMTFLGYYGFTVELDKEDLVISRGLIEKKRVTVPLNRVQSVRIIENPFRQLFGYANVVIDNAGGGLGDSARINLLPLVKKTDINGPLKAIFPDLVVEEPTRKVPSRGKRYYYRIDFLWMAPVIGALAYFFFPYGLFSLLLIPVIVLWGLFQHRSAAFETFGNQLTMRFRGISLQTAYMMKNRIQSMEIKQNYFHRKKNVAIVSARVKSGMGVFNAQVSYIEEKDANEILDWYEPSVEKKVESNLIVDDILE
ncbi:PH domain-containing protein [Sporosarcina jiandibaonis]|uniref:PH domain-containing protein n=1 Tax=Sporosarcina jiandibaonis TaxID=2715535 RepID=UPI001FE6A37C|nr:PH domain-containing protein [Sporosarcina jiandibaonis]